MVLPAGNQRGKTPHTSNHRLRTVATKNLLVLKTETKIMWRVAYPTVAVINPRVANTSRRWTMAGCQVKRDGWLLGFLRLTGGIESARSGLRQVRKSRLSLEGLEARMVPASFPVDVTGSPMVNAGSISGTRSFGEANGPVVTDPFTLDAGTTVTSLGDGRVSIQYSNSQQQLFTPFPGYKGALNITTVSRSGGDVPDGIMVAVAGPSAPHVLVVDAATGSVANSFYAFDPAFKGGVTVSGGLAKVNGTERSLLICGASSGSEPAVSLFDAGTGDSLGAFYAFDKAYRGGVRITLSERGADGASLVVVASTINSHVVAFNPEDYYRPVASFYSCINCSVPKGMYVAAGDLDSDGQIEIVAAAAEGPLSPQVAIFTSTGVPVEGKLFQAFDRMQTGGVRIALADYDRDGALDLLTGSGGRMNVFRYQDLELVDSVYVTSSTNGFDIANNYARGKGGESRPVLRVDGDQLVEDNLKNHLGKVVVLDFWATWCAPCREMIPDLREWHERLKDQPFELISVSADQSVDTLKSFLGDNDMPWTHWFAGDSDILREWNVRGYPTTFILDAGGKVRYSDLRGEALEGAVNNLLLEMANQPGETACLKLEGDHETVDSLNNYLGKVVVLDFWATWCPPCRAMIPHERDMVERLKDQAFELISVSGDYSSDVVRDFIKTEPMPWTHWMANSKTDSDWDIQYYPTIVLIDKMGTVRFRDYDSHGALRGENLERAVLSLLAEG